MTTHSNYQIQRLQKEIEDLKQRKKSQADEIDLKIHNLQGQILNYQKVQNGKVT